MFAYRNGYFAGHLETMNSSHFGEEAKIDSCCTLEACFRYVGIFPSGISLAILTPAVIF